MIVLRDLYSNVDGNLEDYVFIWSDQACWDGLDDRFSTHPLVYWKSTEPKQQEQHYL